MKHMAGLVFLLSVLWWVLSGYTYTLVVSLGVVSVLFVAFVAHRMEVIDDDSHPLHLSLRLIRFWLYLLGQVLLSSSHMVRLVLSPKPDLNPRIVRARIRQDSVLGKVMLGNAITLTPGSVTLDITDNVLEAHAIDEATALDIEKGTFDKRVPTDIEETA